MMKTLLILPFLFLPLVYAAPDIGKVTLTKGLTFLKRDEGKKLGQIKKDQSILAGDQIDTEKGGLVRVVLKDGTIINIGPEAEFVFDSFDPEAKGEGKGLFTLILGHVRAIFPKSQGEGEIYKIKTPVASMGIRGTEILASVIKKKDLEINVLLLSGKAEMSWNDPKEGEKRLMIERGQYFESSKVGTLKTLSADLLPKVDEKKLQQIEKRSGAQVMDAGILKK